MKDAPAQNGDAGGLNHGIAMWGAVVDRNGVLCALAVSTDDMAATWPGSRGIAMLDETPVGTYIELEGSEAWIDRTARRMGLAPTLAAHVKISGL